ncbi:hypothetical protein CGK93_10905 [Arthrobacter sp. YN]|nr:hypothetical protein CGK93_10905 [Arthrobacter sp. YN]
MIGWLLCVPENPLLHQEEASKSVYRLVTGGAPIRLLECGKQLPAQAVHCCQFGCVVSDQAGEDIALPRGEVELAAFTFCISALEDHVQLSDEPTDSACFETSLLTAFRYILQELL